MKPMPATMTNRTMNTLSADQHQVDPQRLLDADATSAVRISDEQEGRQVEVVAVAEALGPGDADVVEEDLEVRRPALRHDAGAEHHLEQQVPADDPGDELAQRGVGERVGRAGDRHRGRELGVAEGRQPAADRGEHERQDHAGPGDLLGGLAGQREDAGADDDTDAEDRQVQGGQTFLELVLRVSVSAIDCSIDLVRKTSTLGNLASPWGWLSRPIHLVGRACGVSTRRSFLAAARPATRQGSHKPPEGRDVAGCRCRSSRRRSQGPGSVGAQRSSPTASRPGRPRRAPRPRRARRGVMRRGVRPQTLRSATARSPPSRGPARCGWGGRS